MHCVICKRSLPMLERMLAADCSSRLTLASVMCYQGWIMEAGHAVLRTWAAPTR